ncbi:partial Citrate lyase subunit beta, partial [uncultured bacterium]
MNNSASAGIRGADVRSDCWVLVEQLNAPTIQIKSKVTALYGDSIRATIAATLAALNASDLAVTVEDSGALPFTMMARVEAAIKRLRPENPRVCLPDLNPAAQYPTTRARLHRTRLYLPGNTPKFFVNAGLHKPDAIILDLEDAVSPDEKDAAQILVRNALRTVNFYNAEKMVRINQLPRGLDDARALIPHGVHAFLIPKIENADEVRAVDRLIEELTPPNPPLDKGRAGVGSEPADIFLIPIIESARGILRAFEIANASPRVIAVGLGLEDYTKDIGAERTAEGRESLWARSQIVNAARAAGVTPLGSVFTDVADEAGLRAFVNDARVMGFEGIGCLHPRQVPIAHQAFAPTPDEIENACRIAIAFKQAQVLGLGVIALNNKMIDAPVVARAHRTIRI